MALILEIQTFTNLINFHYLVEFYFTGQTFLLLPRYNLLREIGHKVSTGLICNVVVDLWM